MYISMGPHTLSIAENRQMSKATGDAESDAGWYMTAPFVMFSRITTNSIWSFHKRVVASVAMVIICFEYPS